MFNRKNVQFEQVITAQAEHIKRLEKMVDQMFNALMMATKTESFINLEKNEKGPLINSFGDPEPDPGEIYSEMPLKELNNV